MNSTDNEVTDIKEIEDLLSSARVCRLALNDGGYPYIVPMCFGYTIDGDMPELYFQTAPGGKKNELIKADGRAAFEIERVSDIAYLGDARGVAVTYECITGAGSVEIVNGIDKLTGINAIVSKYDAESRGHKFSEHDLNNMTVLKLTVERLCCKKHERND